MQSDWIVSNCLTAAKIKQLINFNPEPVIVM